MIGDRRNVIFQCKTKSSSSCTSEAATHLKKSGGPLTTPLVLGACVLAACCCPRPSLAAHVRRAPSAGVPVGLHLGRARRSPGRVPAPSTGRRRPLWRSAPHHVASRRVASPVGVRVPSVVVECVGFRACQVEPGRGGWGCGRQGQLVLPVCRPCHLVDCHLALAFS